MGVCWTQGLPAGPRCPMSKLWRDNMYPCFVAFAQTWGTRNSFSLQCRANRFSHVKACIFSALESHYLTLPQRRSPPNR